MTIDIRTGNYFPLSFVLVGVAMALVGVGIIISQWHVSIILLPLSFLLLTTQYRFRLNTSQKYYQEYLWIFGFRKGKQIHYDSIECIYIKRVRQSQTMHYKSLSNHVESRVYAAYIKFSPDDRIHLFTRSLKKSIMLSIDRINKQIETEVRDLTEEP